MNTKPQESYQVVHVPIDAIVIGPNRRRIDPEKVKELADGIARIGLEQPISVRETEDERFHLITGGHRLEAFRLLGRNQIPARIHDHMSERQARMLEISENLHRVELQPLERSDQIAEWITLAQEEDEPETESVSNGQADSSKPAAARQVSKGDGGRGKKSGVAKAAKELGIKQSTASDAVRISEIPENVRSVAIRRAITKQKDFLEIAKLNGDEEAQLAKIEELREKNMQALRDKRAREAERKRNNRAKSGKAKPPEQKEVVEEQDSESEHEPEDQPEAEELSTSEAEPHEVLDNQEVDTPDDVDSEDDGEELDRALETFCDAIRECLQSLDESKPSRREVFFKLCREKLYEMEHGTLPY